MMNLSMEYPYNLFNREQKECIDFQLGPRCVSPNILTMLKPLVSSQFVELLYLFVGKIEREGGVR